jgi:molecular chaperone IbpA
MTMNAGFSLAPLFRHSVGFDRFDELMESAARADKANSFPPYDILREGEDRYRITMAVAGFKRDDLDITVQQNTLTVSGRVRDSGEDDSLTWLHRGIARRAFERVFRLADHVRVRDASLSDGLLTVYLERVVPEAEKPRMVPINDSPN